jgi:Zn-dependent protease
MGSLGHKVSQTCEEVSPMRFDFDPVRTPALLIALVLGLTIHEFAHAWTADRLGDPTARYAGRVTLNPLAHLDPIGGIMLLLMVVGLSPITWGKPVPINPFYLRGGRRGVALATAAGPLSNLLLAVTIALLWRLIHAATGAELGYDSNLRLILIILLYANVVLTVFNLIPIPPLDGFGILEGLAPPSWLRHLEPLRQYGPMILLLVVVSGISLWSRPIDALFRLVASLAGL